MIKLNGISLPTTIFPDNTSQVWHLPQEHLQKAKAAVHIEWIFSYEGEFLQLAQLKDLLDFHSVEASLELSYLPYGRQDKPISNNSTFALHTFAKLINALNFVEIIIHDPHSDVALTLIDRATAVFLETSLRSVFSEVADLACYPDKGAHAKYSAIYPDLPFIYGEKVRDQSTGKIVNYDLIGNPSGKRVLIIDDICDGGATFVLLAEALLRQGAAEVHLFVSHGLFSRGTRVLFDSGIKRIFTKTQEVSRRFCSTQF